MDGFGRSFQNLWIITRHEFRVYFLSPIIYMIGAAWLVFAGLFYALSLASMTGLLSLGGFPSPPDMDGTLWPMGFLMMFFAPAITMRLISDELRAGTHELLFTAPVRDWEIIVGKWLGAWGVMTVLIIITLLFPLVLFLGGNPDPGLIWGGYLGFWLWTGASLAIGVLTSSMTQHQLVALFLGIGITLFLWLSNIVNSIIQVSWINEIFEQLNAQAHFRDNLLQRGVIDPVDIAYFVGLMAISLFVATTILSSRRWRP